MIEGVEGPRSDMSDFSRLPFLIARRNDFSMVCLVTRLTGNSIKTTVNRDVAHCNERRAFECPVAVEKPPKVRKPRQSLGEPAVPGELQCFDRRASRAGRIAIGHNVNRNIRLLLALGGHPFVDLS